ncbi:MAG: hypothetical protein ACFFAS_13655 [Promethearchaeota archaeon]
MDRDLDDLINDMESDALTRSELHEKIKELIREIQKLRSKIAEQEGIIERLGKKDDEADALDDIQILKDMVKTQRKQLTEKENIIEAFESRNATLVDRSKHKREIANLKSQIDELQNQIKTLNEQVSLYKVNDSNAREIIARLTEENTKFKSNEENSLELLEDLSRKKDDHKNRAKQLEEELKRIKDKFEEDMSKVRSDYETQKEELQINEVEHARRISELEDQVEKLSKSAPIIPRMKEMDDGRYITENKKYVEEISNLRSQLRKLSTESELDGLEVTEPFGETKEVIKEHVYIEKLHSTIKPFSKSPIKNEEISDEPVPIEFKPSISPSETISNAKEDEAIPLSSVESSTTSDEKGVIDGSRKCPKCGNQKKKLIHEELDKTNIIMAYPRLYGKKYRCGECGSNWRIRFSEVEILK